MKRLKMIRTLILLVCVATMAAATMTACDVEDNPANSGQSSEIVSPSGTTAKELIGGWSETERRKMNADGSLQDSVDWSMLDGGEANCIEIAADSIYFFLGNYTYKDGYLAYHYTFDSENLIINMEKHSNVQIIELTDNGMTVHQEGYQIIYKRMSDETLKWYREHFSENLQGL